jgi:hypothetical protein
MGHIKPCTICGIDLVFMGQQLSSEDHICYTCYTKNVKNKNKIYKRLTRDYENARKITKYPTETRSSTS